ncbi:Uncharacterised protein [Bordetella pertussis]|nr:Uncharacterised protein [Bordetella pertussis]
MWGIESSVMATLPPQLWVMRVPASCGKRLSMARYSSRAVVASSVGTKRARPPNSSRRPSGESR